jgi:hypothetical protein
MITLPFPYKSVCDTTYMILGWQGRLLRIKHPSGKVFKIAGAMIDMLMSQLKIKKEDIPGYEPEPSIPAARSTFSDWQEESNEVPS